MTWCARAAERALTGLDRIPGISVMEDEPFGAQASHDVDRMQVLMDVSGTGATGFEVADWLRQHRRIDMGHSDHRRILATLSMADDADTVDALVGAMTACRVRYRGSGPSPADIHVPAPRELQLESVMNPRDAFLRPGGDGAVREGRRPHRRRTGHAVSTGIPVIVPGELVDAAVVDYLRSGVENGMNVPDPADPSLRTLRVVAE